MRSRHALEDEHLVGGGALCELVHGAAPPTLGEHPATRGGQAAQREAHLERRGAERQREPPGRPREGQGDTHAGRRSHGDSHGHHEQAVGDLSPRPVVRRGALEQGDQPAEPGDRMQGVGWLAEGRVEQPGEQHRERREDGARDHGRARAVTAGGSDSTFGRPAEGHARSRAPRSTSEAERRSPMQPVLTTPHGQPRRAAPPRASPDCSVPGDCAPNPTVSAPAEWQTCPAPRRPCRCPQRKSDSL